MFSTTGVKYQSELGNATEHEVMIYHHFCQAYYCTAASRYTALTCAWLEKSLKRKALKDSVGLFPSQILCRFSQPYLYVKTALSQLMHYSVLNSLHASPASR